MHSFSKGERLCNFTLKNLLFSQGNTFYEYPFKIYWKIVPSDLESVFWNESVTTYSKKPADGHWKRAQNPSFPHKTIPANAFFPFPAQVLIAVPAKIHRKAVVRNHLKRIIREAYRQNKAGLYTFLQSKQIQCLCAIVYTGKSVLAYGEMESKIIVSLQKIERKIIEQHIN